MKDKTIKHFESDKNGNTAIRKYIYLHKYIYLIDMCSANGHFEILKLLLELLKERPELE